MIYVSARHYQRVQAMHRRQTHSKLFSAAFSALAVFSVVMLYAIASNVLTIIIHSQQ